MNDSVRMKAWFSENGGVLLILSVLALFCTKTLFNVPLTIMGVIALYRLGKHPTMIRRQSITLLGVLFLCLWLPMLLAFVDAVNYAHSAKTVFPYLRYFLAGVYILQEINSAGRLKKVLLGIFIIASVWCVDALIQYLLGHNIFGQPYKPEAGLAGMFYPKIRLPHLLAVLAPLFFEYVRLNAQRFVWLWLTLAPFLLAHLLGGKRAAWMMLIVAVVAYLIYLLYLRRHQARKLLLATLVLCIIVLGLGAINDSLRYHADKTVGLFSTDIDSIDKATSYRLSIWQMGARSLIDNWFNGVGPRGFRYIDTDYADEDNFWVQDNRVGQTHPHLFILEILVETGLIGLTGYLLFFCFLYRAVRDRFRPPVLPWIISIVVVLFPLNAHLAFYGSYWSSVTWWLVPIGLASICHDNGTN